MRCSYFSIRKVFVFHQNFTSFLQKRLITLSSQNPFIRCARHCVVVWCLRTWWYSRLRRSPAFHFSFYHATLCLCAVFAVTRCPSVRPSVRLSVCLSVCRIDTCRFRWHWVTLNPVFKVTVYSYNSNISKTVRLRDKVTIEH